MSSIRKPLTLKESDLPNGFKQLTGAEGIAEAQFALSRIEDANDEFPVTAFPKKGLVSCPLLGAFTVHYRNFLYPPNISLKIIMEEKFQASDALFTVLAVNSPKHYHVFLCKSFLYDSIRALKIVTHAVDFIVFSKRADIIFFMHEDSPACFFAAANNYEFEHKLFSQFDALNIFVEHWKDWRITKLKSEEDWVKGVLEYFK